MKKRIRLGVNIDHVATVRNARGEDYPSPLKAARLAESYGADSVTIHLREDRRHINDQDLKKNIITFKDTSESRNCSYKRNALYCT